MSELVLAHLFVPSFRLGNLCLLSLLGIVSPGFSYARALSLRHRGNVWVLQHVTYAKTDSTDEFQLALTIWRGCTLR